MCNWVPPEEWFEEGLLDRGRSVVSAMKRQRGGRSVPAMKRQRGGRSVSAMKRQRGGRSVVSAMKRQRGGRSVVSAMKRQRGGRSVPGHLREGFGCVVSNRFDPLLDDETDPYEALEASENKEAAAAGPADTVDEAAEQPEKESQKRKRNMSSSLSEGSRSEQQDEAVDVGDESRASLLSLMLMMVFDSTITVAASRTQPCGNSLQQALKLARLVQKESVDIIETYKAAQGDLSDLSELICKVTLNGLPDPNISGLEPSKQISSIHTGFQAFSPHFRRVHEQQTELADSLLLLQLHAIRGRSQYLEVQMNNVYQDLFPNSPPLEPDSSGGATSLPPPQNVFQQKVYGCVLLQTYREFLSNVCKYLRSLKNQMCGINIQHGDKSGVGDVNGFRSWTTPQPLLHQ
ncbi:uncharacterized protein [Eucyclogobius newberryi]|uniref:uncharacterized protein n=1 Tax=Eucyclogobius newberryi TaxID=166745 RepID=UPI003B5C80D0